MRRVIVVFLVGLLVLPSAAQRSAPAETREYVRRVNERLALYGSDTVAVAGGTLAPLALTKAAY